MLENGYLINCTSEKTLRLLPPLIVRKRDIDGMVKTLHKVLSKENA
jgi:acetylornithine/N-succinyldiaminopimelate aminotransferase